MYQRIKELLICALLMTCIGVGARIIILLADADHAIKTVPTLLDARAGKIENDLSHQLAVAIDDANDNIFQAVGHIDAQISAARADVTGQIAAARGDITGPVLSTLDNRLASIQKDTVASISPFDDLARRYTILPTEIRADREYQGLVAETMGVLGATKVTLGQTAKMSKTIDAEMPKMTEHVESIVNSADQISKDITREADQLTKPQSKWAQFRAWLLTIARIYGAI